MAEIPADLLALLRQVDTPTVCNAIEVAQGQRGFNRFTRGTMQHSKPGDPPMNWLERQIEAHADGSDGGVGNEAMGELQIEGIYPLAYIRMLTGCAVQRVFARTASHFHQAHVDNNVDDLLVEVVPVLSWILPPML